MWVDICCWQPPAEAFGWPHQPCTRSNYWGENSWGNSWDVSFAWWPYRGVCWKNSESQDFVCFNFSYRFVFSQEEKLEPLRNITDDPRIRLLNRLYARKRKELKEREKLKVVMFTYYFSLYGRCEFLFYGKYEFEVHSKWLHVVMEHWIPKPVYIYMCVCVLSLIKKVGSMYFRMLRLKRSVWMSVRWMISCHLLMVKMEVIVRNVFTRFCFHMVCCIFLHSGYKLK